MTPITPEATDGTQMPGSTNQEVISNLPPTLQRNNNDTSPSTTGEDDDDVTVQTSNSSKMQPAWMSYNIKLLLTNKHDTSDSALQHATLTILETIHREIGNDVKIFDGTKQQVTDFQVQPISAFRSKFPVSRSKAHQRHNRSAAAWVLFTIQTRQTLKDLRNHPAVTPVLRRLHCRLIHHQWPLEVTDITSVGFFVGETPTYKLSSTFYETLRSLIVKKANIKHAKIPKFQVALTVVRARTENPNTKVVVRDACTAFELQVPVNQRQAMEELLSKVFTNDKSDALQFVYYKQRHVHPNVFFKAVQMQRRHEQSHRVVAVEGIHPEHYFQFEVTLRQQFPEIMGILPTSKSATHNVHGFPIGRYNILCSTTNFSSLAQKLHQDFTSLYLQHLKDNHQELHNDHQSPRVTSRLPRSDDSSGTIPSLDSRATFFTSSASLFEDCQIDWEYCTEFPSVVETNNSTHKQNRPTSPSVTSGITGMSLSTSAQGGPSYASVVTGTNQENEIRELKDQLAQLKTTIQVHQQKVQSPSAPPAATNQPLDNFPQEFFTTFKDLVATVSNLKAEVAELRTQQQSLTAPSPVRKKLCPDSQTSELHLSEASPAVREDDDASMDHES